MFGLLVALPSVVMRSIVEARDVSMLSRCVELSRHATSFGESPFACVICNKDQIVALSDDSGNQASRRRRRSSYSA